MKLLIVIIATTLLVVNAKNEPPKCCDNDKNLLLNRACDVNGEGIRPKLKLDCEEKYILDPANVEEDEFEVRENGSIYVPDMQSYLLPNE